jgi:hypothetical protein
MIRRIAAIAPVAIVVVLVLIVASLNSSRGRMATSASDRIAEPSPGLVGGDQAANAPLVAPAPPTDGSTGIRYAKEASARGRAAGGASLEVEELAVTSFPSQAQQPGGMLIRSGHAQIEVDSVQAGIARVRRLAQETGALVANTTVQTGREQRRSASLELRVPSDRFDAVVNGLTPIGKVESVNVSAQDVGEEFVDLTARLANARRLEARLIELLANRTGRLSDVLTVERELARVRETIERYEGRLRYLQARVAVSSLTIEVHEPHPVVASHPGENVIAEAFVEAWRRFVLITAGLIASLGIVVPVAALAFAAWLVGRRYWPPRAAVRAEQTAS